MTTAPKKLSAFLTRATAIAGATLLVETMFCWSIRAAAASTFTLTKYTASPTAMNFPAILGAPGNDNEIPPAILVNGNSHDYFVSGYMSYSCLGNWGMFGSGIHRFTTCSELLGAVVDNVQTGYLTESMADALPAYKRNFNGIFSVVQYNDPASPSGVSLLAVMHEENKGEARALAGGGVGSFRNSVSRSITNLVNGDTGSTCITETNGCYFAFVSASTIPYTAATSYGHNAQWTDYGPIVWPSQGYISPDGTLKIANGPRHPHAIIVGSYVYVFYQDMYYTNGLDNLYNLDVGDRRGGMKVIRAQLPNVQPGNWYAYFQPAGASAGDFTEPALPSADDFTGPALPSGGSLRGPRATPLFTNIADPNHGNYEGLSFAVAQVTGQNLYVGVEEYADYGLEAPVMCLGKMRVALRTSTDLIHWSSRIPLYDGCQDYSTFALDLPEFVDASSTSNNQIDLNNFYIVGTKPFHYYYMHVGLSPM